MTAACVVSGSLALDFLPCLRCSAAAVLFASPGASPFYRQERHSARSFVQGGAPLSTILCTGRSATQHGPLYREERHSARSFVQAGAPLSTVLCTGRSATQHDPLYRQERHSARSFVQGGAPLSTILCTGATQHGPEQRVPRCWG